MVPRTETLVRAADAPAAVPSTPVVRRDVRFAALDMTKGVLVIAMVIYHCFNYSADYTLGFKYLPFLPPSFILITGLLIVIVYGGRAEQRTVNMRLVVRGLRLLALFIALNLIAQLAGRRTTDGEAQGVSYFFGHWVEIFVSGEGRYAAFQILVAIAYLLLFAPLLLLLRRCSAIFLPALAVGALIWCELLSRSGGAYGLLLLCNAGIIGMVAAEFCDAEFQWLRSHWYVAVLSCIGYFFVRGYLQHYSVSQITDAFYITWLVLALCFCAEGVSLLRAPLAILGKYSLICYVAQIAILQVCVRFLGRLDPFSGEFFLQMLALAVLMLVIAWLVDVLRKQSSVADNAYRAVFA